MRKRVSGIMLLVFVVLGASGVLAHSDGHAPATPISTEQAIELAANAVVELASRDANLGFGRLKPSWTRVPAKARKVHLVLDSYIIVSIQNEAEDKTLYVLMSDTGGVIDANLTGKFPHLTGS